MGNMRITNSMLVSSFLNNLNKNLNNMSKLQQQMAANKKIVNISDDPVGVIASMRAREGLRDIESYQDNINNANSWLAATEDAIKSLNEVLKNAYETAVNMSSDPGNSGSSGSSNSATGREAVLPYIQQLRDEIFQIANSKLSDKYIFGGFNTTTQPFGQEIEEDVEVLDGYGNPIVEVDEDGNEIPVTRNYPRLTYNGYNFNDLMSDPTSAEYQSEAGGIIEYYVSFGYKSAVNYTGMELMNIKGTYEIISETEEDGISSTVEPFEKNIFQIFDDFAVALENDDQEGISKGIKELQAAQDHVMKMQADIGGRTNRLDIVESRLEDNEYMYTVMKSDVEDIDLAEIVMWYKMAESVYNAALSSGAQIMQPSLMDYLR